MNLLSQAKASILTYAATTDSSIEKTVVAAGTRVCLRAYGMLEYPSTGTNYSTRLNFRTSSQSDSVIFSDIPPLVSIYLNVGQGSPMYMVRIPGEGVLFDDGLYIELEEITTRTTAMNTLVQMVYT